MLVRRATVGDGRGIAEVHVRAWRAAYRGLLHDDVLDGLSVGERERAWRELLRRPGGSWFTLVAETDARVEGFCSVAAPSADEGAGQHTAEVTALYVDPERWRAGVGTGLLDTALGELREGGWREAILWVLAGNDRARSFYARHGFEPDGGQKQLLGASEVRLRRTPL